MLELLTVNDVLARAPLSLNLGAKRRCFDSKRSSQPENDFDSWHSFAVFQQRKVTSFQPSPPSQLLLADSSAESATTDHVADDSTQA